MHACMCVCVYTYTYTCAYIQCVPCVTHTSGGSLSGSMERYTTLSGSMDKNTESASHHVSSSDDRSSNGRCMYVYTYTYIYTYIHAYIHIHVCMYTYTYTHTHTHIHTYTGSSSASSLQPYLAKSEILIAPEILLSQALVVPTSRNLRI
jgi:hypothetical protein